MNPPQVSHSPLQLGEYTNGLATQERDMNRDACLHLEFGLCTGACKVGGRRYRTTVRGRSVASVRIILL